MVKFETLLSRSEAINHRQTIEVAAFYLTEVEGRDSFTYSELLDFLRSSRSALGQNMSGVNYHDALTESYFIVEIGDGGYTLSVEGREHYSYLLEEDISIEMAEYFIEHDFEDGLYQKLVNNINRCYAIGAYQAVPILSRKLLENLLIDVLRRRYGLTEEGIPRFYNKDRKQFRRFSDLLDELRDNIDDFEHYSDHLDPSFVDSMEDMRKTGNASAHSIEKRVTQEELESFRRELIQILDTLLRMKLEMEKTHREHENED